MKYIKINLIIYMILLIINCKYTYNMYQPKYYTNKQIQSNADDYTIEVIDRKIILNKNLLNYIKDKYNPLDDITLNELPIFDPKEIKNSDLIDLINRTLELKGQNNYNIEDIKIETEDNRIITCTYLNRNKSRLVISATGFGHTRKAVAPIAELFDNCDILFVNYWAMDKEGKYTSDNEVKPSFIQNNFSHRFERDSNDIKAALHYIDINFEDRYQEIIGFGKCFGTYVITKAQAELEEENRRSFDKLILDSPWLSVHKVAKKIALDPYLSCNLQNGGAPNIIKYFTQYKAVRNFFIVLTENVFILNFRDYSLIDQLNKIENVLFYLLLIIKILY